MQCRRVLVLEVQVAQHSLNTEVPAPFPGRGSMLLVTLPSTGEREQWAAVATAVPVLVGAHQHFPCRASDLSSLCKPGSASLKAAHRSFSFSALSHSAGDSSAGLAHNSCHKAKRCLPKCVVKKSLPGGAVSCGCLDLFPQTAPHEGHC